jgi:hypothetical protein
MNNDLNEHELENLLRGLAPAAASPALRQRVDEELKLDMSWLSTSRRKPQHAPRWIVSAGWAAMGAAAAIAVMSQLPQQSGTGAAHALASASTVLPASTIREWDDSTGSGIHHGRNRQVEKHALVISRELGTWVDPLYSAQTTAEIPSKQQLLLPVSFRQ